AAVTSMVAAMKLGKRGDMAVSDGVGGRAWDGAGDTRSGFGAATRSPWNDLQHRRLPALSARILPPRVAFHARRGRARRQWKQRGADRAGNRNGPLRRPVDPDVDEAAVRRGRVVALAEQTDL